MNILDLINTAKYDWISMTGKSPKTIHMKPTIYKKLRRELCGNLDTRLYGKKTIVEFKNLTSVCGMEIKFLSSKNQLDFEIS